MSLQKFLDAQLKMLNRPNQPIGPIDGGEFIRDFTTRVTFPKNTASIRIKEGTAIIPAYADENRKIYPQKTTSLIRELVVWPSQVLQPVDEELGVKLRFILYLFYDNGAWKYGFFIDEQDFNYE